MKKTLKNNLKYIFLFFSIFFFLFAFKQISIRYKKVDPFLSVVSSKKISAELNSTVVPVIIEIPSINAVLPIEPGNKLENSWEVSTSGVTYYKETPIPGENGNSVLYGHNWPNLLGNLKNVNRNDEILVYFSDGTHKRFDVYDTFEITPDRTHILEQTQDSRITLYTCSGFLDSKRLVVVGKLVKKEA